MYNIHKYHKHDQFKPIEHVRAISLDYTPSAECRLKNTLSDYKKNKALLTILAHKVKNKTLNI